ncbi:hypothetical protein M5K25_007976 [Dendrobium thyrsiflorum]|uniref:Reverse transcriptase zinc-binding domain-containing protein n=1 Tax=Dendrobium thyrsiflorum TaxID=117978 RepID=A0ABD0V851_DENTH
MCSIKWQMEPLLRWELGLANVFFWQDKWVGTYSIDQLINTVSISVDKVKEFITNDRWDVHKLLEIMPENIFQKIIEVRFNFDNEDKLVFSLTNNNTFNTMKVWNYFRTKKHSNKVFAMIWHRNIPATVSVFVWRLLHNFVPADDLLIDKGFNIVSKCQCCCQVESIDHIFLTGPIAVKLWLYFEEVLNVQFFNQCMSIRELIFKWFSKDIGHISHVVCALIVWNLWVARNNARFNGVPLDAGKIITSIHDKIFRIYKVGACWCLLEFSGWGFPGWLVCYLGFFVGSISGLDILGLVILFSVGCWVIFGWGKFGSVLARWGVFQVLRLFLMKILTSFLGGFEILLFYTMLHYGCFFWLGTPGASVRFLGIIAVGKFALLVLLDFVHLFLCILDWIFLFSNTCDRDEVLFYTLMCMDVSSYFTFAENIRGTSLVCCWLWICGLCWLLLFVSGEIVGFSVDGHSNSLCWGGVDWLINFALVCWWKSGYCLRISVVFVAWVVFIIRWLAIQGVQFCCKDGDPADVYCFCFRGRKGDSVLLALMGLFLIHWVGCFLAGRLQVLLGGWSCRAFRATRVLAFQGYPFGRFTFPF